MTTDRIREYIEARVKKVASGCWEWQLSLDRDGYGNCRLAGPYYQTGAYRASYFGHHGLLPDARVVMHSCDNPRCCNPEHLTAGTQLENISDSFKKGCGGAYWYPGMVNPKSILTDDQVRRIRFLRAQGVQYKVIAAENGCSKTLAVLMARGKRWTHVV